VTKDPAMTSVCLIGVEQETAGANFPALDAGSHQIRQHPQDVLIRELQDADIVFAGGEPAWYLTLLKRVREARPALPSCRSHANCRDERAARSAGSRRNRLLFGANRDAASSLVDGVRDASLAARLEAVA
jgi:hypothetical protein